MAGFSARWYSATGAGAITHRLLSAIGNRQYLRIDPYRILRSTMTHLHHRLPDGGADRSRGKEVRISCGGAHFASQCVCEQTRTNGPSSSRAFLGERNRPCWKGLCYTAGSRAILSENPSPTPGPPGSATLARIHPGLVLSGRRCQDVRGIPDSEAAAASSIKVCRHRPR